MSLKKIVFVVLGVLLLAGIIIGSIVHARNSVTAVATGKAFTPGPGVPSSVAAVRSSLRPTSMSGATAFGRITHLYVKEGDHVKSRNCARHGRKRAAAGYGCGTAGNIASTQTDVTSFAAAENTASANVAEAKADLEQKRLDYGRAKELYTSKLISKQDFDSKQAAFDMSSATLQQRTAALAQSKAQTQSQRAHVNQAIASQRSNYDALDKTISRAPFDALVTNVPVREGETVVVGIQNASGSTLMSLADMSVITAEVKVDETDIVNVSMNQPVDVTVDALPGRVFKGHVTEVGDQAPAAYHRRRHVRSPPQVRKKRRTSRSS